MAWTCTLSQAPTSCGHRDLTIVRDDGSTRQLHLHVSEIEDPFTAEDEALLIRLAAKRLFLQGLAVASMTGRVVIGDEATNVKSYDLIGPGPGITKTNVQLAWTNILPGANGQRQLVDFTGASEFRLVATANLVGTGPFGLRVVRDSDDAVLYENAAIVVTGQRELDTDWLPMPTLAGLTLLRAQIKSETAQDDPIIYRLTVLVR